MLKGDNILLRSLRYSDLEFLEYIENNKANWRFGSEEKEYTYQQFSDYIANSSVDISIAKQFRYLIDFQDTPVGFIDLFDYTIDSVNVGIIISEDFRNRGFGKEALDIIIDYVFGVLGVRKIYVSISKDNLASIRLFTSCNFDLISAKGDMQYFVKLAEN